MGRLIVTVSLLFAGFGFSQNTPSVGDLGGSIGGVVKEVGTGAPIPGAVVFVMAESKRLATETDQWGRYTLRDLPSGKHDVIAQATAAGGRREMKAIELSRGQELSSLNFALDLTAAVSGVVLDDEKKPIAGATVWLVKREYQLDVLGYFLAAKARTNSAGEYSFRGNGIEPGRGFLLLASTLPDRFPTPISDAPAEPEQRAKVLAPAYYPNSPTPEAAQPFLLRPGELREHVDFVLLRETAYCLNAQMLAQGTPSPLHFVLTDGSARSGAGFYSTPPSSRSAADGRVRICGLHSGTYEVVALGLPPSLALWGSTTVTIGKRDADNVMVDALPSMSLTGKAIWDGTARPEGFGGLSVRITPSTGMGGSQATPDAAGRLMFSGLSLNEFVVQVNAIPKGCYLKDITYGGLSVLHSPLRLGSLPGDAELRVVLAQDAAYVSTKTTDKDGNAVPNVTVAIVPVAALTEGRIAAEMMTGTADQNGIFTSPALPPGSYYVLASSHRIVRSPEMIGKLFAMRTKLEQHDIGANSAVQVTLEAISLN
jgi:hypothetical protein